MHGVHRCDGNECAGEGGISLKYHMTNYFLLAIEARFLTENKMSDTIPQNVFIPFRHVYKQRTNVNLQ